MRVAFERCSFSLPLRFVFHPIQNDLRPAHPQRQFSEEPHSVENVHKLMNEHVNHMDRMKSELMKADIDHLKHLNSMVDRSKDFRDLKEQMMRHHVDSSRFGGSRSQSEDDSHFDLSQPMHLAHHATKEIATTIKKQLVDKLFHGINQMG